MATNTPWTNNQQALRSGIRMDELDGIIADLTDAMLPQNLSKRYDESPEWTRQGRPHTEPGKMSQVRSTLYRNPQYLDVMQNQLRSASHERAIAEAAFALNTPYQPPVAPVRPAPFVPPRVPGAKFPVALGGAGGGVMLLLDLLLRSGDTNANEKQWLDNRDGPPVDTKPTIPIPAIAEIMQLLQRR